MKNNKKLIEVSLPLDAINKESAREKSIRHGHPSTLHLWWARRPLAAARAVIFAQMVDDPSTYVDVLRSDAKLKRKAEARLKARRKVWDEARALAEKAQGTSLDAPEPGSEPTLDEALADLERERLFGIIEDLVKWENTTNETVLQRARDEIWQSWRRACAENADHPKAAELFDRHRLPAFHDPFAGGGALPLEAQRLGLTSYASDLNPVAVLINKAMIEIPPKFAGQAPVNPKSRADAASSGSWKGVTGLAEDVRYYGQWMRDEAEKRIGHLYPKVEVTAEMVEERPDLAPYVGKPLTVIAWLWARTVKSPNPAFADVDVPLASTFMLSTKKGKEAYVEPVFTSPPGPLSLSGEGEKSGYRFTVKVEKPKNAESTKLGTTAGKRSAFKCLMSGVPITYDYIRTEGKAGRMGARLMAIVAEGARGRVYLAPIQEHEEAACRAQPDWKPETPLPDNPRDFKTPNYGIPTFGDLFTDRQLVALTTFSDLVGEAIAKIEADALIAHSAASSPSPDKERGLGGEVKHLGITQSAQVSAEKLELARQMRKHPTDAEALAWEQLRDRRCLGLKFRRQQVIRGLIVDFYCAEHRLVVELDGEIHADQVEYDQARDAVLNAEDIRVLRVPNACVMAEGLEGRIREVVTSPPGPLSLSGEGEKEGKDARALGLDAGSLGARAYAEAVGVYLAFAVDRVVDRHTSIATWDSSPSKLQLRNTFARQAIPMTWDFGEGNPFCMSSGTWSPSIDWVAKSIGFLPGSTVGNGLQADASTQDISQTKVLSTDPPYYDNIGYADLSDFFYIWLRRSLRPVFPSLFATMAVPKAEELVATPYRHGSKEKAEKFFLDGMTQAMHRLAEQAHPSYPVTIYYAFKQSETKDDAGTTNTGWDTFLAAVIKAGFAISGTWPMRTELGNRMIGSGTNALASSIVLVCRPRYTLSPSPDKERGPGGEVTTRREFLNALKSELPDALAKLQAANIAPVDLAQAAIGPGMAIFTRYAQVLDAEGKPLSVRTALALINQVLDEVLAEQEGDFDPDTRFALAWFEQHGFTEGEFGVADVLARAKGTAVDGVAEAGIIASGKGKVRILKPDELPADWDPASDKRLTVWEMVHHLIRVLESSGESSAANLAAKLGTKAETARELCYRLYSVCERKGRAADAMAYNALVQSWPEITRLAQEHQPSQTDLFG